jgi:exosortase
LLQNFDAHTKLGVMSISKFPFHMGFGLLLIAGAGIFFQPISLLTTLVFQNGTYSHIVLVPIVSIFLVAVPSKNIFVAVRHRPVPGIAICAAGLVLYGLAFLLSGRMESQALHGEDVQNDYLSLCAAGAVAWVCGSFIAVYGTQTFKKARFAMLLLLFTIPIPTFILERIVETLQHSTAEVSDLVFRLTGVSYRRTHLVFELSNVAVQVAEQCSGIRSSLSLFILSLITGYLFLRSLSRRLILFIAILPITVIKNAFRIVTITLLANFVDMHFLTSHWIHRSGGIPFFAVALAMFIPLVWLLRKTENCMTETVNRINGSILAKN